MPQVRTVPRGRTNVGVMTSWLLDFGQGETYVIDTPLGELPGEYFFRIGKVVAPFTAMPYRRPLED